MDPQTQDLPSQRKDEPVDLDNPIANPMADLRYRVGLLYERVARLEQQVYERKIPRQPNSNEEVLAKLHTLHQMMACVMDHIVPQTDRKPEQL